jgi:ABC-2 type transport system ATP-binding protein
MSMGEIVYTRTFGGNESAVKPLDQPGEPELRAQDSPAIAVEDLVKDYKTCRAVDHVSFTLPRGGTIGLVGSNGAGKTSTIFAVLGLLTPSSGRVVVFGEDMTRRPQRVLHRLNFASPYMNMPARLTIRQNLTVFGRLYGVKNLKARIGELAWEFELGDVMDRSVGSLSAGQKSRASLAKALLNEPELLVLDEPTASLDPNGAAFVHRLLENHRRAKNASMLIASHNMGEVERLCDVVVIMCRGRIVESGTPNELRARYGFEALYDVVSSVTWTRDDMEFGQSFAQTKSP